MNLVLKRNEINKLLHCVPRGFYFIYNLCSVQFRIKKTSFPSSYLIMEIKNTLSTKLRALVFAKS